jgi:hypothetical protein
MVVCGTAAHTVRIILLLTAEPLSSADGPSPLHHIKNKITQNTLQTIFHLCIPKNNLAEPQLNISKKELSCSHLNDEIL